MSTIISDPLQSVPTTATRWDIVVFKVEDTIFRVNRHGFTTASPFFKTMFRLPTGNNCKVQGTTDDDPIVLEGYKAVDFDALLRVLYPTCQDFIANRLPLTRDQWISALRLSTIWEMKEVREFAIKKLSNDTPPLTPVEKVNLARDHKVASWLVEGLVSLTFADRDFPPEALETLVGLRTAFQIASIRLKKRSSCAKTIPLTIDNGDFTGLSIDDLRYPCCWCPFVKDQVRSCHSCDGDLSTTQVGSVYTKTTPPFKSSCNHCHFFVSASDLLCSLCHKQFITRSTTCQSCNAGHHSHTLFLFFGFSARMEPSVEILVKETFQEEIREYEA